MDFQYLESIVLTRVKTEFNQTLKTKYPELNFTTEPNNDGLPQFPTVYIHLLPSPEIGEDLEGITINGISATFQIKVADNQNNNRAKEVMNEVIRVMKTMRFAIKPMPYPSCKDDTYYSIARAKRVIGANDIL